MTRAKTGLLTQAEVDALPTGTVVWITWSGGNGPHRYDVVNEGKYGVRVSAQISSGDDLIQFVGKESYHTHVWLTDPKSKRD
jgi:hypothetical protein